jgi:small subunit ribosomal protein S16
LAGRRIRSGAGRSPRDGRFIETIGHYNPQTDPSTIVIDTERFDHWVARGAQPSGTVKQLVRAQSSSAPAAEAPANELEADEPEAGDTEPAEPQPADTAS